MLLIMSAMSARPEDPPVRVIHLFNRERKALLELLGRLEREEWNRATVSWVVSQRHSCPLFHDNVRRLPTRGIDAEMARSRSQVSGDVSLTRPFFLSSPSATARKPAMPLTLDWWA